MEGQESKSKHPGGRPTSYDPKYCSQLIKYANPDKKKPFTIAGFACKLKVAKSSLYEWAKHNPEFSNALDLARQAQETQLVQNGLLGSYNAAIVKLCLINNHGWADKQELEHSGDLSLMLTGRAKQDDRELVLAGFKGNGKDRQPKR